MMPQMQETQQRVSLFLTKIIGQLKLNQLDINQTKDAFTFFVDSKGLIKQSGKHLVNLLILFCQLSWDSEIGDFTLKKLQQFMEPDFKIKLMQNNRSMNNLQPKKKIIKIFQKQFSIYNMIYKQNNSLGFLKILLKIVTTPKLSNLQGELSQISSFLEDIIKIFIRNIENRKYRQSAQAFPYIKARFRHIMQFFDCYSSFSINQRSYYQQKFQILALNTLQYMAQICFSMNLNVFKENLQQEMAKKALSILIKQQKVMKIINIFLSYIQKTPESYNKQINQFLFQIEEKRDCKLTLGFKESQVQKDQIAQSVKNTRVLLINTDNPSKIMKQYDQLAFPLLFCSIIMNLNAEKFEQLVFLKRIHKIATFLMKRNMNSFLCKNVMKFLTTYVTKVTKDKQQIRIILFQLQTFGLAFLKIDKSYYYGQLIVALLEKLSSLDGKNISQVIEIYISKGVIQGFKIDPYYIKIILEYLDKYFKQNDLFSLGSIAFQIKWLRNSHD